MKIKLYYFNGTINKELVCHTSLIYEPTEIKFTHQFGACISASAKNNSISLNTITKAELLNDNDDVIIVRKGIPAEYENNVIDVIDVQTMAPNKEWEDIKDEYEKDVFFLQNGKFYTICEIDNTIIKRIQQTIKTNIYGDTISKNLKEFFNL